MMFQWSVHWTPRLDREKNDNSFSLLYITTMKQRQPFLRHVYDESKNTKIRSTNSHFDAKRKL